MKSNNIESGKMKNKKGEEVVKQYEPCKIEITYWQEDIVTLSGVQLPDDEVDFAS